MQTLIRIRPLVKRLLFVLTLWTLATPLLAQTSSTQSATTQPGPAANRPIDARLEAIEDRLEVLLAAKDERIANATEQTQRLFSLFQVFGVIGGLIVVGLSIRGFVTRAKEESRQATIDNIVRDAMALQKSATTRQLELLDIRIGTEKADSARGDDSFRSQVAGVTSVNNVIDVVRQTLEFRLQQEATVAQALQAVEQIKAREEKLRKGRAEQAKSISRSSGR